jgi:hypothetical protein
VCEHTGGTCRHVGHSRGSLRAFGGRWAGWTEPVSEVCERSFLANSGDVV